VHFAWVKTDEP